MHALSSFYETDQICTCRQGSDLHFSDSIRLRYYRTFRFRRLDYSIAIVHTKQWENETPRALNAYPATANSDQIFAANEPHCKSFQKESPLSVRVGLFAAIRLVLAGHRCPGSRMPLYQHGLRKTPPAWLRFYFVIYPEL